MPLKVFGLIFLLTFVCFSSSGKIEKYYFSGSLLEDPDEVFALPDYRVPQKVTFYNIIDKSGKPKKVKAKVVDYKFDGQGHFLGTTHRPAKRDYVKNCIYKDGKLTDLIYNSGNVEKIKYDSASNRVSDCLYSADTLKRRVDYLWNKDTVIATTTNGLSGKIVRIDTIQVLTNDEIDTLRVNSNFAVKSITTSVYKKGVLQRTTVKASGTAMVNGVQRVDTAQIIDASIFDSTEKKIKRIYTTHRGNNVSESHKFVIASQVYTDLPDGRPMKIEQYNGLEEVLTRTIEFKYFTTK